MKIKKEQKIYLKKTEFNKHGRYWRGRVFFIILLVTLNGYQLNQWTAKGTLVIDNFTILRDRLLYIVYSSWIRALFVVKYTELLLCKLLYDIKANRISIGFSIL